MNDLRRVQIPFFVPVDVGEIPAGGERSTQPAITIGPYDFIWTAVSVHIESGGSQDFSIKIRDEGTQTDFQKDYIPVLGGLVKPNQQYNELPVPWRFKGHTSIIVTIRNDDDTNPGRIKVVLHGYLER